MEQIIQGFTPASVFRYFEEISRIPRGSGNEAGVAAYLSAFAQERGIACTVDTHSNVYFRIPATADRVGDAALLLQGHTDMVCEKNGDTVHDFNKDPLRLRLEGNALRATDTTLGGDDGIAVAMMMAVAAGEIPSHPAIECLFTTEEETGMGGALAFDYTQIKARYLINLDSEEEGVITAGCAGGIRTDFCIPIKAEPRIGEVCRISLRGLCGGHSGECIHRGRANANLLLGRLLLGVPGLHLISLDGGSKDNAIPRECTAIVAVPSASEAAKVLLLASDALSPELASEDADCTVECERISDTAYAKMLDADTTCRILGVLANVPNGVLAMSHTVEGLVDYSRNLGVVCTDESKVRFTFSTRSAKESRLDESVAALDAFARLCSGTTSHHSRYPGWDYVEESPLREAYCRAYRTVTGKEARVNVIHAGLECGYIKSRIPDMDIISIGPDMEGIHSPAETLYLDSVERVWQSLVQLMNDWHIKNKE